MNEKIRLRMLLENFDEELIARGATKSEAMKITNNCLKMVDLKVEAFEKSNKK